MNRDAVIEDFKILLVLISVLTYIGLLLGGGVALIWVIKTVWFLV